MARRALLRSSEYRKLWSASTVSELGTQATFLAVPIYAVSVLDADATALGLITASQFLPLVLFSLPTGVLADRFSRKRLLVLSDLLRALVVLLAGVAAFAGLLNTPLLILLGLLLGTIASLSYSASQAILPDIIEAEDLVSANTGLQVSRSVAQVVGPGAAGALIRAFGIPVALLVDAASYVVSGSVLGAMRVRERLAPSTGATPQSFIGDLRGGLGFVLGHPLLRPMAIASGVVNLGVASMEAIYVLYAIRLIGLSELQVGLTFTIGNFSLLAALPLTLGLNKLKGSGAVFVVSLGMQAAGLLLIASATPSVLPVVVLGAALLLRNAGSISWGIVATSLRQRVSPPEVIGRVAATVRTFGSLGLPVGAVVGGVAGDAIGIRPTLILAGLTALGALVYILVSDVSSYREVPAVR